MRPSQAFARWHPIQSDLLEVIEVFRPEELTYVSLPGSWPVGQSMPHVAEVEDFWLHALVRGELEPQIAYPLDGYPESANAQVALNCFRAHTPRLLDELEAADPSREGDCPDGILWRVLEPEIHDRGEGSLIFGRPGQPGLDG